jgi:two-component system, cell cycle response regulator
MPCQEIRLPTPGPPGTIGTGRDTAVEMNSKKPPKSEETVRGDVGPLIDAARKRPPCLVVIHGAELGHRYYLDQPEVVIGRLPSSEIMIDHELVSRRHARIDVREGTIALVDLESTNGTYVNAQKVDERELKDGDLLSIGGTVFKFLAGGNIEADYHDSLYQLSTTDGLTQTFNRRYFMDALERELARAKRHDRGLSLILLDLDHFKTVNDTYGHAAGDAVLSQFAGLVKPRLRREEIFARVGGEEFAILAAETEEGGAVLLAQKIRNAVDDFEFRFGEKKIHVTVSAGVAYVSGKKVGDLDPETLLKSTDAKLYRAKRAGRNRVVAESAVALPLPKL